MLIMGIDNGQSGALALLDTDSKQVKLLDTPLKGKELDSLTVYSHLLEVKPDRIYIESCFRPNSLIRMQGEYACIGKLIDVPVTAVPVVTWKTQLTGINSSDKSIYIDKCKELYPEVQLVKPKCRTDSADRAEATLIAHYGYLLYLQELDNANKGRR